MLQASHRAEFGDKWLQSAETVHTAALGHMFICMSLHLCIHMSYTHVLHMSTDVSTHMSLHTGGSGCGGEWAEGAVVAARLCHDRAHKAHCPQRRRDKSKCHSHAWL